MAPTTSADAANINLIVANVDGLYTQKMKSKAGFLKELAVTEDVAFICVSESHLNGAIRDAEVKMDGYTMYRADRTEGRRKGGVAIYVKDNSSWTVEVLVQHSNSYVETIGIYVRALNLFLLNVYRPPECDFDCFKESLNKIDTSIKKFPGSLPEVIIVGDLNLPHMNWSTLRVSGAPTAERGQAETLSALMEEWCLAQHVGVPTRGRNILDLVLCNNEDLVKDIRADKSSYSDHSWLVVQTNMQSEVVREAPCPVQSSPFSELNFQSEDIDWMSLKRDLSTVDWLSRMAGLSVEEKYNFIMTETLAICRVHVPKRRPYSRKQNIPRDRRLLMRKRKRLRNKINNTQNTNNINLMEEKILKIESDIKLSLDRERATEEQKAAQAIQRNPKYFFKFAKSKSNVRTRIGPLEDEDGTVVQHPREMAALLKRQYDSVFSTPDPNYNVVDPGAFFGESLRDTQLAELELGRCDFVSAASRLRPIAAAGPDGFPAVLLKTCAWELSMPLVVMWQASLRTGTIPVALKTAKIIPIYKGGRRCSPASYRPVALTSHIVKIFERIMADKIVDYLDQHSLLNERQHGFRHGRSCLSQLLDHHDRILDALERSAGVDVIYLDMWKAFDQVDHGLLLHKARDLGISGEIGHWLHAFLSSRTQTVVVEGGSSDESVVVSGVPQGSVLGPLLFLILLGDIDAGICHSIASSFADDTRVVGHIASVGSMHGMQRDLENLYSWADQNNMAFNSEKFQLLRYGNPGLCTGDLKYISYDATEIREFDEIKDLGVILQSDASFSTHIQRMVGSARNQASWILRTFDSRGPEIMLILYRSLVLPHLEYCSVLWSPSSVGDIQALEGVQRTFTSKITSVAHMNYWQRISALKLYSLERRRERYCILYVYKAIHGMVPNINGKIKTKVNLRLGLLCDIGKVNFRAPSAIVKSKLASFAYQGPRLFNALPRKLRETEGFSSFKCKLDKFLKRVPDEPRAPQYHRRAASNSIVDQLAVLRFDGVFLGCP